MNWEQEKELKQFVLCCSFRAGRQKQKTGHSARTTTCIHCGKSERDPIHSTTLRNAVKAFIQMEKDRDRFRLLFENVCDETRILRHAIDCAMPVLEMHADGSPGLDLYVKEIKKAIKLSTDNRRKKHWRR